MTFHKPLILCSSEGEVLHINERKINGCDGTVFEVKKEKERCLQSILNTIWNFYSSQMFNCWLSKVRPSVEVGDDVAASGYLGMGDKRPVSLTKGFCGT